MSESADLKKSQKIWAGHRSYATKLIADVEKCLQEPYATDDLEHRLKCLQNCLSERLVIIKDLDDKILMDINDELIETEIEDAGDCRERMHGALVKISTFFEKQSKAEQAVESVNQQPVSAVQQNKMGASGQSIRLPKLQLKKFSGDPKLWQEWWDLFEATVHVNV